MLTKEEIRMLLEELAYETVAVVDEHSSRPLRVQRRYSGYSAVLNIGVLQTKLSIMLEVVTSKGE